ncbi:hypothetical protein MBSD_n1815 [Mizugakiibacter sediminis]|uniref:Uncharacterized protein n=1 Tax=Mizugakiibacter sediminis TaxID=1475481 RepID=A0A0K8QQ00_9GAMM|nr:hypothetical protein MBSD_n1815 [Mizugakiibacter sediminis]
MVAASAWLTSTGVAADAGRAKASESSRAAKVFMTMVSMAMRRGLRRGGNSTHAPAAPLPVAGGAACPQPARGAVGMVRQAAC